MSRSFNCRHVCVFKSLELSIIVIIQAGLFLGIDTWKMCVCVYIVGTTFVIMCCEQVYMYTCIVIYGTTTNERWRPAEHRQTDCVSNVHKYKSHLTWKKKVKTFVLSFFFNVENYFSIHRLLTYPSYVTFYHIKSTSIVWFYLSLYVCIWSIRERLRFLLYIIIHPIEIIYKQMYVYFNFNWIELSIFSCTIKTSLQVLIRWNQCFYI